MKNFFGKLYEKIYYLKIFKNILCLPKTEIQNMETPVLEKTLSVLLTGCHAMPVLIRCCFFIHQCYRRDTIPRLWSPGDLPRVLRIWESTFYPQGFFNLHSFLLFKTSLGLAVQPRGVHAVSFMLWFETWFWPNYFFESHNNSHSV